MMWEHNFVDEVQPHLTHSSLEDSRQMDGKSVKVGGQPRDNLQASSFSLGGFEIGLDKNQRLVRPFRKNEYATNSLTGAVDSQKKYHLRGGLQYRDPNKWHRLLHEDEEDPWETFQQPKINHPKAPNYDGMTTTTTTTSNTDASSPVDSEQAAAANDDNQSTEDNTTSQKSGDDDSGSSTATRVPSAATTVPSPTAAAGSSSSTTPKSSTTKCHSLACRTFHVVTNPIVFGALALVMLYLYVRRRSRRMQPSHGAYRAVAAQYVSSAFDEGLSPEDYASDDEADEFWTHGKKSIEMGTFKDDLTLDEVNG